MVTSKPAAHAIVGRDAELGEIAAFVQRIPGGSAALVLDGAAGAGKTSLWRAGVAAAHDAGYLVLEARPAEAESELAFVGVGDLLADAHEEMAALPALQRRALSNALLLEDAGGATPDQREIAVAVLGVLRALTRSGPLLLAIDDVQWLDRPSGAALAFAIRRAAGDPVGILLAQRTAHPIRLELDTAAPPARIEIGPLSLGATRELLRERLGVSYPRATLRRVHERAAGNPFFALELARALEARGGSLAPSDELPVPQDLGRLLRERLAALPPATAEPLAAVAALGEPPLRLVGGGDALDPAFQAGVLGLDGGRVRFAHPLLAAAAYEALPPHRRQLLHRRLADVVESFEQRARHLALGAAEDGPDPELAGLLEQAAAQAYARGAPTAAADLAERALRADDEAELDVLVRRTAAAAEYERVAGDPRRARELLDSALLSAPPGPLRARLLRGLALCTPDVGAGIATLEAALAESADDLRLEAEIRTDLGMLVTAARSVADGERFLEAAVEAAERVGDRALLGKALSALAVAHFFLGRGISSELMERALALDPDCESLPIGERPITRFGMACKWLGDVDRSRSLLEEACRIGEERGDSTVDEPMFYRCFLEVLSDTWQRGLERADRLVELTADLERPDVTLHSLGIRAILHAHLGNEAAARRDATEAAALDELCGSTHGRRFAGEALALLELSLDRPADALSWARLATAFDPLEAYGEPAARVHFPLHAEAAIAVGEQAEAEALLDEIEPRAVALDREWALACIARCHGLLAAARGDEQAAAAGFERALAEHTRVRYRRFDLGRTLLAQGETLRRFKHRRAAREAMESSVAIFDELGAALWTAKARRELARVSGRRREGGLTETERRVAELVAAGRSNKEVASDLHVTVRTVEANLTKVYAKLGVRSRTELASRLSA